jgi:hypothetical protein
MSARGSSAAFILALLATAVFAFSGPLAIADEPEKEKETAESETEKEAGAGTAEKEGEPVRTYTNADLERLFGPPQAPREEQGKDEEAGAAPGAPKPPDALAAMNDAQARGRMKEMQAAEVEKVIAEKEARIAMLEQRVLRIRNPLLPRPENDLTPEERKEWEGLTAPQRVELTEKQLDQVRKELAEAEARLKELKSK